MGGFRRLGLSVYLLLIPFVLAAPFAFGACQGQSGPAEVTLAELVAGQEDYADRLVETRGVVRPFGEAEGATTLHYVVEDEATNRVALRPNDVAEPYRGREVVVVGAFRFSEEKGRSIEIESIRER